MNLSDLWDEGDSSVILGSLEYTAREVRILNFYKVEIVQFFGHHQNNIARVSGHLKNKQELIEGFRQKLHDFEINKPEILDISLSREYL